MTLLSRPTHVTTLRSQAKTRLKNQCKPLNILGIPGYVYTFLLYINDLPHDVICNIVVYDDATLFSKCDKVSDSWQELELASELEVGFSSARHYGLGQEGVC